MAAMWNENKKKATVLGGRTKPSVELPAGVYEITVIVAIDGEPQYYSRQFIVGDAADDLTWVKPIPGKKKPQKK